MRGNFKKLTGALTGDQCKKIEHAWHEARRQGYPIDAAFDIKPATELDAADAYKWFSEDWSWLGGWCRRNVGVFYAWAVREADPRRQKVHGRNEHFHFLIHVGSDELRDRLRVAWRLRRADPRVVHCRRADYEARVKDGHRGNAFLYRTKQREDLDGHLPRKERVTRKPAGLVLGKRYKISKNLWR